jgi:hypothetical protein
MMPTASRKVSGLGHHATSAIDPNISAHACTIRAAPFHVTRWRTGDQLILVQKVAGTHAKRGHDEVSPVGLVAVVNHAQPGLSVPGGVVA